MNPELERRLRRYGATVDAAASAEEARVGATASPTSNAALADLDNVVVLDHRPHRFYRVLAVAAASVALVAGGIAFTIGRSSPSTSTGDQPIASTAAAAAEPIDHETTEPGDVVALPTTTARPTTTTTAAPEVATAPGQGRPTTSTVCSSYTPTNAYHLDICDSGAAVRLVQQRLRASVDSSLTVDGYFGPGTRDAVRSFQQQHGLTVDGQVGPATWELLVPDAPGIDVDGSGMVDPDEISTS